MNNFADIFPIFESPEELVCIYQNYNFLFEKISYDIVGVNK